MTKLIITINTSKGNFYEYHYKANKDLPLLNKIIEINNEFAHVKPRDKDTERPGRVFESSSKTRHAIEQSTNHIKKDQLHFAKKLSKTIEELVNSRKFQNITLISSKTILGEIRTFLSKKSCNFITKQIPKDVTHLKPNELLNFLTKEKVII